MNATAISVEGLTKTFPRPGLLPGVLPRRFAPSGQPVLKGVALDVATGEIVGLLGPNGAGKTTLLEILATLLLPDGGRGEVGGYDLLRQAAQVRTAISYCAASVQAFYPQLSGLENLEFFAALNDIPRRKTPPRIREALDCVGINGAAFKKVQCYSEGMKQRLALARVLLTGAPVLLFDEPTRSLDVDAQREFWRLLRETLVARLGKTVLLVTHSVAEAKAVCDRVAILDDGRIARVGAPAEVLG